MFAVDEDGSWWYTECAAEEESADAPQDGAEDENSGVLVLNSVLPQLDSLVVRGQRRWARSSGSRLSRFKPSWAGRLRFPVTTLQWFPGCFFATTPQWFPETYCSWLYLDTTR